MSKWWEVELTNDDLTADVVNSAIHGLGTVVGLQPDKRHRQLIEAIAEVMPAELQREVIFELLQRSKHMSDWKSRSGSTVVDDWKRDWQESFERWNRADLQKNIATYIYGGFVRITLFELAAPAVPGCRVTIEGSILRWKPAQWSIAQEYDMYRRYPFERRRSTVLQTTKPVALSADSGERKRVFFDVPAWIYRVFRVHESTVSLFSTYLHLQRNRLNFDSALPHDIRFPVPEIPGIELIERGRPGSLVSPRSRLLKTFRLLGDRTRPVATYSFKYKHSQEVHPALRVGSKWLHIEGQEHESIQLSTGIKLTFTLVGGHDYQLYATEDGFGIAWVVT
jgi:hypothetical protein